MFVRWCLVDSHKAMSMCFQLKKVTDELYESINRSHNTSNSKCKAMSEAKANNSEKKKAIVSEQVVFDTASFLLSSFVT